MRVERLDFDEWERALPNRGFEVFHLPEALRALDEHAQGDLHLYGGFKGEQPIALLPVFVQRRSIGTVILSPPPSKNVPRLGPVLMPTSPKQRKHEKINREFTEAVLERERVDSKFTLFRMVCNTDYDDPRPYVWNDMSIEPHFTYVLDIGDRSTDDVLASFSKSLRREIRDADELDVDIGVEGLSGTRDVYQETKARYEEQGRKFPVRWPYVRDLASALDDRCRTYVARTPDGEFLSGVTVLYSNDQAYFWQGGTRAVHENVAVNSLIHWRIVEDIAADEPLSSVDRYDLMGANTERLCQYKAKFGADLVPYYAVESGGTGMDVAKRAYQTIYQ